MKLRTGGEASGASLVDVLALLPEFGLVLVNSLVLVLALLGEEVSAYRG